MVALVWSALLVACSAPQVRTTTLEDDSLGTVRLGDKLLRLESAVAVWLPAKNQLELLLFPFAVSSADIETARTKGGIFVIFGKSSPNPKHWPSWAPHFRVTLTLAAGTTELSMGRVERLDVNVPWMRKKNHAYFSSGPAGHLDPTALRGDLGQKARVGLRLTGEITDSADRLSYSIDAETVVRVCGPPRCPAAP